MEQVLFSLIFAGLAYWLIRKAYKTQKIANKGVGKKVGMVCLYLIGAWAATVSISCMGSAFSDDTPEKPKSVTPVATVPEREEITPDGLFLAINDIRRENDLPQFKRNPLLDKSAQLKCDDMVKNNYYDHKNPKTGKSGLDYIEDVKVPATYISENLNAGVFKNAREVMDNWMESDSHKAAILDPKYTETGFAICEVKMRPADQVFVNHFVEPAKEVQQTVVQQRNYDSFDYPSFSPPPSVTCTYHDYTIYDDTVTCQ